MLTEELVWNAIGFEDTLDRSYTPGYKDDKTSPGHCGTPRQRAGLKALFMEPTLEIPYNTLVEAPFVVKRTSLCRTYTDISITVTSVCEDPSTSGGVYQYGVKYNPATQQVDIVYDEDSIIRESETVGYFSVTWPAASSMRTFDNAVRMLSEVSAEKATKADAMGANLESRIDALADSNAEIKGTIDALADTFADALADSNADIKGTINFILRLNICFMVATGLSVMWLVYRNLKVEVTNNAVVSDKSAGSGSV